MLAFHRDLRPDKTTLNTAMAIQFLCPHCSATITVSNSSHGKRGTCPACRKKLLVPRPIGDPPPAAAATAVPHPTAAPHPAVPTAEVWAPQSPSIPPTASAVAVSPTDFVPEAPASVTASISQKRRKRSSNAAFAIGIPVMCFIAFMGVMATIFWNSQPELKGTISGAVLPDFDLPVSKLSLANLDLKPAESDTVAAEFKKNPERFLSELMKCSIGASGRQLTVKVSPGSGYEWFTVNPSSNAVLTEWVKKHSETWNAERKVNMQQVATALCQDKLKRLAGERVVIDAAYYRDEFALATQVKGFGYLVEAVAESQRAICAHEDANGTLYFSLPKETQSFILQGRSFAQKVPVFPGKYTVNVSQVPETTDEEPDGDGNDVPAVLPQPEDNSEDPEDSDEDDDSFIDLDPPDKESMSAGDFAAGPAGADPWRKSVAQV